VEVTNARGIKRPRILGADLYNLYNRSRKSVDKFLNSILKAFLIKI